MSVCKERAWDTLTKLSFERVTGTAQEKEAAEYLKAECEKAGVEAHLEEYEIDMPEIQEVSFTVTKPVYKEYKVIGIGNCACTPDEGITAPFAYVENGLEANLVDVKGKICLISGRLKAEVAEMMVKKGALGYISIHGSFYDEASLKDELRPRNTRGKNKELPGIVMHISDAEELVRSHPEEVKLVLKQNKDIKGTAQNVVATIEGTDLKDEVVVFTAHYDSVRYSKGAWDNATGAITILELLHHYAENKPRRTVKFVFCGSEEIGLVGSRKYCEAHQEELKNYIYNINFDMTGVTLGYEYFCCTASEEVLHGLQYLAKLEGYPVESKMDTYSSDSTSFASAGVPSCTFARLAPHGGAQIHNHYDTMEHLDADSFMITLNFVVKYSEQIINSSVNLIPRKLSAEIEKKIEEGKKWMAEAEKKDKKEEESKGEPNKEEKTK